MPKFLFYIKDQEISIQPLGIIFKQKEHEFARLAVAISENIFKYPDIVVSSFFTGVFHSVLRDKKHKWIIFIAFPVNFTLLESDDNLLFCDPVSHEIYNIQDNIDKFIEIDNVFSLRQNINNKIPKIWTFTEENYYKKTYRQVYCQEFTLQINQKFDIKAYTKFVNKLKQLSISLKIEETKNMITIMVFYEIELNLTYHLNKIIINEHPNAFGYEKLNSNYDDKILKKKIQKTLNFIKTEIKTPLNTDIKIGNMLKYQDILGQITSIQHVILPDEQYTSIKMLSNYIKNYNIVENKFNIKEVSNEYIPLVLSFHDDINFNCFDILRNTTDIDINNLDLYSVNKPQININYNISQEFLIKIEI